jgi:hypothetical protein
MSVRVLNVFRVLDVFVRGCVGTDVEECGCVHVCVMYAFVCVDACVRACVSAFVRGCVGIYVVVCGCVYVCVMYAFVRVDACVRA